MERKKKRKKERKTDRQTDSQHWVDYELGAIGLDDGGSVFGAEHMRKVGSLRRKKDDRGDM